MNSSNFIPAGLFLLLIVGLIAVKIAGPIQGKDWQRKLNIGIPIAATLLALLLLGESSNLTDSSSEIIGGIIFIGGFLLLALAGFAAPRCFWLTTLGITAGFIVSNIFAVKQLGQPTDAFDHPIFIIAIGLLQGLPVVFGVVGGGALLRKIVQHFRARRKQNVPSNT